ncbi:heparinase II/III family protein [bacterium]|nr:heparinase II/III family protein [bacterium]
MVKRAALIGLFLLLSASQVLADLTQADIDSAINKSSLKHPYLYFNDGDKPVMLERIKSDPECRDIVARLLAEANRLLSTPVDYNIPIQGKNTRAGWSEYDKDGKYASYYYAARSNAFDLAFAYQITGDEKYARKAFEFADAFCDLTTWTQRPHEFPVIYSRIMPWNVPDDQVNFSFDHINGDSGRIMAAVYDWLYPALDEAQRDRIRGALIEKVITRVRGDYEYHWWAVAYRCNWCGVCNSGVGLAGLALLTEDPQLTDVVAESYNRIDKMLNELGVDGGWQEGGGYWNYGVHTSAFFADALKRLTNGKYDLFQNERLRNNPVSFAVYISVPGKGSLNFEDSGGGRMGDSYFINKLATETKNGMAAWYRNEFYKNGDDIFDIVWPRPTVVKPVPPDKSSIHFRTIDWWVMRSDFDNPENVMVAGKAGKNDDPHHGHLDIGHFIVSWRGQYYIRDIGSGSYDEKYFDDVRWDYPQASSVGHNVVFVNGEKQLPGKMRKKPYNYDIGGKVLEFRTTEKRDYVIMDPTNAYPKKEMKSWRRHIILEKPVITVVLDEVGSDRGAEIEARFHSECLAQMKDGYAMLKGDKGAMALIPVVDGGFTLRPGRHACQAVNATRNFFWVDYFGTVVNAKNDKTIIGTIILPVKDDSEAREIVKSVGRSVDGAGNLKLSFKKSGKTYSYLYKNGPDGLVLEK